MVETIREKLREFLSEAGQKWSEIRVHVLAFLAFVLGLLELVDPYALSYVLPDRWAALVPMALGAAIFLLRKVVPPSEPKDEE